MSISNGNGFIWLQDSIMGQMTREPAGEDLVRIKQAISAGDKIVAINTCISITGCDLTKAQSFIKQITPQVKCAKKSVKLQMRRNIWQRLIFAVKD